MAEERVQRRLAAILAADVVGYSRLMEEDEAGTLAVLKARRRDVLSPLIAKYHGRLVKVMGDGVLVEFTSAVNAVQCAVDLQRITAEANEQLPESRRVVLRIGINLGDVIVDGSDLYGDGVNLAARLESLGEPGDICVSGNIYEQVKRKLEVGFDDLGRQMMKNLSEPVQVYRVRPRLSAEPERDRSTPAPLPLPSKPSVAVLPFTNMSGDAEQAYFADGITEDIITELSRFKTLFVIARNSSFAFKGQAPDLREVGRKLGVKYLVEGSVRKSVARMRITAQLIEAETGTHIWAERYDSDLAQVLEVQDTLVRTIVSTIGGKIEGAGKERAKRLSDGELRAYDLYLRAATAQDRNTREDYSNARNYLQQAIVDDPTLAQAHHHLSLVNYIEWMAFWVDDRARVFADAVSAARQSLALDDSNSSVHAHVGVLLMYSDEYDEADFHFRKALELNPNDSKAQALYGFFLTAIGRPNDAIVSFDLAARLNPFQPSWTNWLKGIAYFTARSYREAILSFKAITLPMNEVRGWLSASYAYIDDIEQAGRTLETFLHVAQSEMATPLPPKIAAWGPFWRGAIPYRNHEDLDHLYEGLRRAGMAD